MLSHVNSILNPTSNMLKHASNRDVTINHENQFKLVTIQIGWDAKQIWIQLGDYMNVCLMGTYCL